MDMINAVLKYEKTAEVGVAFITGVLGPLILLLIKQYFSSKGKSKTIDKVTEAAVLSSRINITLNEIKNKYKADRVFITQFHNGGNYYPTGKSIQKFSMFYEVVSNGTSSIQDGSMNVPVSLLGTMINMVSENNCISVHDVNKDDETGTKHISRQNGVKSWYMFSIKSMEGHFIGMMGVEFTKNITGLGEVEMDEIHNKAIQLGVVIMEHLNKTK